MLIPETVDKNKSIISCLTGAYKEQPLQRKNGTTYCRYNLNTLVVEKTQLSTHVTKMKGPAQAALISWI